MFKSVHNLSGIRARFGVNQNTEDMIRRLSHESPHGTFRLRAVGSIPGTNPNLFAHLSYGQVIMPPNPTPILSKRVWLFFALNFGQIPSLAQVRGDFHSGDLATTTGMRVSRDFHGLVNVCCQGDGIVVKRLANERVETEFINDIVLLVPPSILGGNFSRDLGWQVLVVPVMIAAVGFMRNDTDTGQPLDGWTDGWIKGKTVDM
jgi:hypothetical protein